MILSEHVWKIGDWFETTEGDRYFVYKVESDAFCFVNSYGGAFRRAHGWPCKHLPDCDSWTWQPPATLQLKEGCWYERRDGQVVGPARPIDKAIEFKWAVGVEHRYKDNGRWRSCETSHLFDLIREVPAPVPKYRPFANAEAFEHCGKVLKGKNNGWDRALVVCLNSDDTIVIGDENVNYKYAFEYYTFLDGTPFGVKVDE